MSNENTDGRKEHWHRRVMEGRLGLFAILTTVVVSIGGVAEIVPMFSAKLGPEPLKGVSPYTPLEVAGRDIYIREGCYVCHSQMVRPMRSELLRYGEWSRAGEYAYDHPFLLGSRRIGPDLQRVGGKYPDAWHYEHMRDPRSTSPGSIMPKYGWLLERSLDAADVQASVRALARVGVPYTEAEVAGVPAQLARQGDSIVRNLATMGIRTSRDREIVAVIAYLQRLGRDGKAALEPRRAEDAGVVATSPASEPGTAAAPNAGGGR
ncbi:MAG TPA: cytochrome-c oxidase, cbb3-type subunit II [Longimicrobiales bacterium]|nr:cytochrome-c oxidase, cbb3-type subunit II [Longimicrobiales bacterium]